VTHAEIIAEMRFHGQQNIDAEKDKPEYGILTVEGRIARNYADRLEAAHKREVGALKQRCAELNAEVAAKDEVIKRLNDAISEEQRRKMATTENPSAVGDCAKLRAALVRVLDWLKRMNAEPLNTLAVSELTPSYAVNRTAKSIIEDNDYHISQLTAALAAPPRNCDRFGGDIDKLREACARERGLNPEENFPDVFPDWLLALAQKGGAK